MRLLPNEQIALTTITASELLAGVHNANTEERLLRRQAFVDQVLAVLTVIPFDLSAASVYAQLMVELRRSGHSIPLTICDLAISLSGHEVELFPIVTGLHDRPVLPSQRCDRHHPILPGNPLAPGAGPS